MALTSTGHDPLATWDEEHLLHPWSFDGPSLMIVKGEGSLYWDADGREYIDAKSVTGEPSLRKLPLLKCLSLNFLHCFGTLSMSLLLA